MENITFDTTPRYAPDVVMTIKGRSQVTGSRFCPAGTHPDKCPIRADWPALELRTIHGSRWYGCQKAYINSELRMVVVGFPAGFEEMAAWEPAKITV